MKKYVDYRKMSKKEQRALNARKRVTWGERGCPDPVTRIVPDKKKRADKYSCRGNACRVPDNKDHE